MQVALLISGFGGQGVMFAGQLLAYAAMEQQLEVTWIPSYGPEMRGGTAHCFVVISDEPIGSPMVRHPDAALLMNTPSVHKYEQIVASGGLLVYNQSLITVPPTRTDVTLLPIPATQEAETLGSPRLANMVMLGAAMTRIPVVRIESLRAALSAHLPAHHRDLLPANERALQVGAEYARQLVSA